MQAIGIDMSKDTLHASFDDRFVSRFMNTEAGIDEFLGELRQWEITRSDATLLAPSAPPRKELVYDPQTKKIEEYYQSNLFMH